MIHIPPGHPKLRSLILCYLQEEKGQPPSDESPEKRLEYDGIGKAQTETAILHDEKLHDFGNVRYRLLVYCCGEESSNEPQIKDRGCVGCNTCRRKLILTVHCAFYGWDILEKEALAALQATFGETAVFVHTGDRIDTGNGANSNDISEQIGQVCKGFEIAVQLDSHSL